MLTVLTLAGTGCDRLGGAPFGAVPAETGAPVVEALSGKRQAVKTDVPLDAGCPLGSEALLGLNLAEKGCNSSARTRPAGPVGSPITP